MAMCISGMPCAEVPYRPPAGRSRELAHQRKAAEQSRNREYDRADHVKRGEAEFTALVEQRRIERIRGKSRVAAEDAGHQKQPPGLRRLAPESEIARDQPHHGRARDVDDEGTPGESSAH